LKKYFDPIIKVKLNIIDIYIREVKRRGAKQPGSRHCELETALFTRATEDYLIWVDNAPLRALNHLWPIVTAAYVDD
jgi:hypothetical protein